MGIGNSRVLLSVLVGPMREPPATARRAVAMHSTFFSKLIMSHVNARISLRRSPISASRHAMPKELVSVSRSRIAISSASRVRFTVDFTGRRDFTSEAGLRAKTP
ncbi:Uncharacterised protein [Mycobacteroides abscessus subsp. abscessus]|nr:Uncharacterised protein [Mycobacteroides abscessus subsp. abscessus]